MPLDTSKLPPTVVFPVVVNAPVTSNPAESNLPVSDPEMSNLNPVALECNVFVVSSSVKFIDTVSSVDWNVVFVFVVPLFTVKPSAVTVPVTSIP